MEGKRFGRLLVLELAGKKGSNYAYRCICDCGNVRIMPGSEIRNRTSVSCGCWARESLISGRNIKPKGEASKRYLFNLYKGRAKYRDIEFSLKFEEFIELTNKSCNYCNVEPLFSVGQKGSNGNYLYNGVDRVDSSLGYTPTNSVTCCGRCNQAKNNMTCEEFKNLIERIFFHYVKK